jgi:glycosyltransferase involved in cell wall biosynthesis
MKPLVSIVITSYNYERFLRHTIDSALGQTYPHVEVVVADDGSTDASPDIIREYGDRVRAVFQPNGGGTAALNTGFAAATGEIVMFLDSDDALRSDAVARVVDLWRDDVTNVQFRLATIDAEGRPLGGAIPNISAGRTPEQVRSEALRSGLYPIAPTSGNAYAKSFLERLLPLSTARFPYGPDGPINAVAPLYGDVLTIGEPLGFYRIHGHNFYAQKSIRPEMFAGYVAQDFRRVEFFCEHARLLGIKVPDAARLLDRAFYHLQYRLASRVLGPERHPVQSDTRFNLVLRGMRAFSVSQDPFVMRAFAALWMIVTALTPRELATPLVAMRFVGGQRPKILSGMLKALRVVNAPRLRVTA